MTRPASEATERAALACVLLEPSRLPDVRAVVDADDFADPRHVNIYGAMASIADRGDVPDARTVECELERRGLLDSTGGLAYLNTLDVDLPDLSRLDTYAREVADLARRRRAIEAARDFAENGAGPEALERLREALDSQQASAAATVRFVSSDELLRDLPTEPAWLWEGALVLGAATLGAGPPKVSKSTLARALARNVADGKAEFLGRRLHRAGAVVYASEEGTGTLAATFPRRPNIHLVTRDSCWPKPTWTDLLAAAATKVRETGAVLCVLDTFSFWSGLTGEQEKDAGHVQPMLDALAEITAAGAAVFLIHHHRKGGGEAGEAIRGSNAIAGAVDAFLELERVPDASANHRALVVTSRWTAPPVLVVSWTIEGGYEVIGEASDRAEAAERSWPLRIADALPAEGSGSGATLDDLEALLGADRRKWSKPLQKLLAEGAVERSGEGKKGDPYRYRIPSPDSVPAAGRKGTESVDLDSVLPCIGDGIKSNSQSGIPSRPARGDGNGSPDTCEACERIGEPCARHWEGAA